MYRQILGKIQSRINTHHWRRSVSRRRDREEMWSFYTKRRSSIRCWWGGQDDSKAWMGSCCFMAQFLSLEKGRVEMGTIPALNYVHTLSTSFVGWVENAKSVVFRCYVSSKDVSDGVRVPFLFPFEISHVVMLSPSLISSLPWIDKNIDRLFSRVLWYHFTLFAPFPA